MMPTRYTLDVDLKSLITNEAVESSSKRTEARKVSACVATLPAKYVTISGVAYPWRHAHLRVMTAVSCLRNKMCT